MIRLLLIRHGQTDWNLAGRWQGHADIPLNAAGRQQAAALAERLATWNEHRRPSTLYTSPLLRAAETAATIGDRLGLAPQPEPRWRERHVGVFSGLTTAEARHQYPQAWAQAEGFFVDPPEGETHNELGRRAQKAFNHVVARHSDETIAIVSHGGLLHALVAHVLGIEAREYGRFTIGGNTGLTVVGVNAIGPRLIRLNDTAHLAHAAQLTAPEEA